ncbi:MAG: hypothetical protein ABI988_03450 [Nitrospirota bacterium]
MAKRKTILVNPLDTLVPNPKPDQTGTSPSAANTQSAGRASVKARAPTPRSQSKNKDSTGSSPATQVAQPPSAADVVSRIQSLEEQNEYIKWLAGGAILLAILL